MEETKRLQEETKRLQEETKRLHIGGLFPGVTEGELKERFSKFGTVTDVAVKSRKDSDGSPLKTFAYVSLKTNDADLKKCFNTYSKTKWKGSEIKIQLAKENFINRLEQERQQQKESPIVEKKIQKSPKTPKAVVQDRLSGIPGVEKFQMKGAPPGTAIPGEQDWIVGKYGRVLPVVNIKKSGSKKLLKVDPSKLTHNLKRFTEDIAMGALNVSSLTWEMEDADSEITKKRKGEFPEGPSRIKKNMVDKSEIEKRIREVLANSERLEKERKMKENQLEVVPLTSGSVVELKTVDFADDDVELDNDVAELARFDSDSEDDSNQNKPMKKPSPQKSLSMVSNTRKNDLSKNKPNEKSKIADFQNNTSENEHTIIKSPSVNKQHLNTGSAIISSLETPNANVRIVEGKRKLKAFAGTKSLDQNTPSKQTVDTVTKVSVVEVSKSIKKAADVDRQQQIKTPEKMPKGKAPEKTLKGITPKKTPKGKTPDEAPKGKTPNETPKGKTLINTSKDMDAPKNNVGVNSSKSVKNEKKSLNEKGAVKKNLTTANADNNTPLRNTDENSVSSGDTDDVILKKKLKLDIHTDQKMLAKPKQVQTWLSGQRVGDEFSAGVVAGSDQFHKSMHIWNERPWASNERPWSSNERPWSRFQYESGDEEDVIDDFEQFAKIELRKFEMNKQKEKMSVSNQVQNTKGVLGDSESNVPLQFTHKKSLLPSQTKVVFSNQVQNSKIVFGDSKSIESSHLTHKKSFLPSPTKVKENNLKKEDKASIDGSSDEDNDDEDDTDEEEGSKSESTVSNYDSSEDEEEKSFPPSPTKVNEKHQKKENKASIDGSSDEDDDDEDDSDEEEKSLTLSPTNVNENHQEKDDKASIDGRSDEDDDEDDSDEEGSKSESTASNFDSSEDEDESDFENIIADEMKKVISTTCKSNENISLAKMSKPTDENNTRNVSSSASPFNRKEEVSIVSKHGVKVSGANKNFIKGTCSSSDETSDDDDDSEVSDTETQPVKEVKKQLAGLTNDSISNKTKDNTPLSLKVVKKSDISSSDEISDDSDSSESSQVKVLSKSSTKPVVMKTVDKPDSTSSDGSSDDSIEPEMEIKQISTTNGAVLMEKQAKEKQTKELEMEIKQTSTTNGAVLMAKQAKEKQTQTVMETKKVIVKTQSKSQQVERSKESDKKRLEALKQRKLEALDQKSAIQKALASTDKGVLANKKIVFDSDDSEDEISTHPVAMETSEALPIKPVPDKSSRLFESSSSGDDSNSSTDSDDDDDADKARFNIKQQFEGTAGRKLASLQSSFGNDERFKLDARFAEPDSENEGAAANDEDVAEERLRSMQILQSIVGVKNVKAVSRQARLKATFRDIATLKYDPSKEEHKGFEMKMEPKKDMTADSLKSNDDESEEEENKEAEPSGAPMPEIGKEKFYEISDSLKEAFAPKSQGKTGSAGFSLLAAFGKVQHSEDEDSNEGHDFEGDGVAVEIPSILRTDQLSLESRFKVDDDDSEEENEEEHGDDDEGTLFAAPKSRPADMTSVEPMDVDPTKDTTKTTTPATFFFRAGDQRLKDGAMFYRKDDLDTLREKWLQKRPTLVENYKSKHKNFRRKHADHNKNKPQIYKKKR